MTNEPRLSSTDSPVMRGIWKSSIREGCPSCRSAPRRGRRVWSLRVELDDELLLHGCGDLTPLRLAEHLRRERIVVGLQPRRHLSGELGGVADDGLGRAARLEGDHVALLDLVARDVDPPAVDGPVAVADQLPRLTARARETETDEHVVEPALEDRQQVLAGDARLPRRLVVVRAELLLEDAVVAASLLLLAKLDAVLALLLAPTSVVARRVRAALDAALVGQAALALQEELLAFTTTLLALGGS